MDNLLVNFRRYVYDHYGLIDIRINSKTIREILSENKTMIDKKHADFNELTDSIKKFIKRMRSAAVFNYLLKKHLEIKNIPDTELYKKANIDRRVYSRLKTDMKYHPGKKTVIALGLALNLNRSEMDEFLSSAGYCFNYCSAFDLVIMFCIEQEIYQIDTVNALLIEIGEKILHKE
jgi:hypothetical protein